ncbi:MAG: hypothetical protein WCG34_11835 [Leptolinea sp.]
MTPRFQPPTWLNRQIIAQIVLVILFLALCAWISVQPNPFDAASLPPPPAEETPGAPNPTQLMLNATAFQVEIEENRDQTLGIVFGGIMLVGLIVASTLLVIGKK